MSKLTDISNSPKGIQAIRLINKDNLFKEVKAYTYKNGNFFYCFTAYGAIHISGSSITGPADKKDLVYVFNKLTNKNIKKFKFMQSTRVSYLIEEISQLN